MPKSLYLNTDLDSRSIRLCNRLLALGTINFELLNNRCYLYVSGGDTSVHGYGFITTKNGTAYIQEVKTNSYVTLSVSKLDLTVECKTYLMAFSLTEL